MSVKRPTIHKVTIATLVTIFLIGAVLFYIKDDTFKANASIATAFFILLPELLFRYVPWVNKRYSLYFIHSVELITANLLAFNALGALGLYYLGSEYDGFLHFIAGFLITFFACFLVGAYLLYKHNRILKARSLVYASFLTIIFSGLGWELFEYYGDSWWGTIMASQPGQPLDTWVDIAWDSLGILIALPLAYYQFPILTKIYSNKK